MNIFGSVQVRDVINLICFFGVPESGQQLLDRSLPAQIGSTSGFEEFRERESVEQKWDHTNLLYILSYWILSKPSNRNIPPEEETVIQKYNDLPTVTQVNRTHHSFVMKRNLTMGSNLTGSFSLYNFLSKVLC